MFSKGGRRTFIAFFAWLAVSAAGFTAAVLASGKLMSFLAARVLLLRAKPPVEGGMIGRVLGMAACVLGVRHTTLDQVGGTIGSEETGVEPYIRSDLYDYGVYTKLRYETRVNDRAEIACRIHKRIFEEIQKDPTVDIAIPFIYSYCAGRDMKEVEAPVEKAAAGSAPPGTPAVVGAIQNIQDILVGSIHPTPVRADPQDLEPLTRNLHVEACRRLGWTTMPAIIRLYRGDPDALPHGRGNTGG